MVGFSFRMVRGREPAGWPLARVNTRIRNRTRTLAIMTSPSMGSNAVHVLARTPPFSAQFLPLPFVVCVLPNVDIQIALQIAELAVSKFHTRNASYARKMTRAKKRALLPVTLVKTNPHWRLGMPIITKKVLPQLMQNSVKQVEVIEDFEHLRCTGFTKVGWNISNDNILHKFGKWRVENLALLFLITISGPSIGVGVCSRRERFTASTTISKVRIHHGVSRS